MIRRGSEDLYPHRTPLSPSPVRPTMKSTNRFTPALTASCALAACAAAGAAPRLPAPAYDPPAASANGLAVLSGGCFWGVQGVFEHVRGVRQALSGYDGGAAASASYETVSTGSTGHAESVRITFDPKQISYGEILRIFFSVATDPTQVNRQFPDEGPSTAPRYGSPTRRRRGGQPLHRPAERRPCLHAADRHAGRSPIAVFHRAEATISYLVRHPGCPLHRHLRPSESRRLEALFPLVIDPRPSR